MSDSGTEATGAAGADPAGEVLAGEAAVDTTLLTALEAVLMVVDEPLESAEVAQALGITPAEALAALTELAADYDGDRGSRRRGFELRRAAGGWRIYSRADHHGTVADFITAGQSAKLSQAALETLAVIAYRQPVTRARISAIRGVNVDGVVRTLLLRGLIVESGADATSGAVQFVTSRVFLESMGLESLDELPDIAPYLPAGDDVPTVD
ncbi:SMC-Scp complex subunit ScpB [Brevibacterium ihuae]|uniref:SMC-Scp complex subunit ScpB n=1 Tax=Brevibacterium ihuae TaxID=1631743 RepID=UPI000C77009A|nr:SMC-Scp complex subunit ScpB [Brevibacterium ihuae]